MATPVYYFTEKGFQDFVSKLEKDKKELARLYAEVNTAAEDGVGLDRGNALYEHTAQEAERLSNKVYESGKILKYAQIVSTTQKEGDKIIVGATVYLLRDGKEETWLIGGFDESDPKNRVIAYNTPLGEVLRTRKPGDNFAFRNVVYKIISVA